MVCTRGKSAFQQEYPLFHALSFGDAAAIPTLCTPQEAAKCGPGGLSVLMLALLLGADEHLPQLVAAGAPLEATLCLKFTDSKLHQWLAAAQLTNRAVFRQQLTPHCTALTLALSLGKVEQAMVLVSAGAELGSLVLPHPFGRFEAPTVGREGHRGQLREHALSHYCPQRLPTAPAPVLGQLALVALQLGRPNLCLAALETAAARGVYVCQLLRHAILYHAAKEGQVKIVLHMAQHSPHIPMAFADNN